ALKAAITLDFLEAIATILLRRRLAEMTGHWEPCKQKHVKGDDSVIGDQYTWVALDRNTKLVLSYRIGKRTAANAYHFVRDLAERVHGRIQLTTDGFVPYVGAVEDAFGADID